jgi:hypothetical protein
MKAKISKKPRIFSVNETEIKDYGKIELEKNELVSFVTKSGKEFDFTAKEWGFYVTPSINDRLQKEGFKVAIVKNKFGKIFVMAVEKNMISSFNKYCLAQDEKVLQWLDNFKD